MRANSLAHVKALGIETDVVGVPLWSGPPRLRLVNNAHFEGNFRTARQPSGECRLNHGKHLDGLAVVRGDVFGGYEPIDRCVDLDRSNERNSEGPSRVYGRGRPAALLDPTPGVAAEVLQLPRAEDAIAAIRTGDPDQRKVAVDALLKLAASRTLLQQSAAAALAMVSPDNADQRKAAVEALLKLASSPDETSQKSAAAALATLPPDDAQQRKAAVEVLLKLIAGSDWGVAVSAAVRAGGGSLPRMPISALSRSKTCGKTAQRNFFFVGSEWIANALAALLKNGTDQRKTMIIR